MIRTEKMAQKKLQKLYLRLIRVQTVPLSVPKKLIVYYLSSYQYVVRYLYRTKLDGERPWNICSLRPPQLFHYQEMRLSILFFPIPPPGVFDLTLWRRQG